MTPQTFRGKTQDEAHERAEKALGEGAVVLATRRVRKKGLAGVLGASDIEVTAVGAEEETMTTSKQQPFAPEVYRKPAAEAPPDPVALLRSEFRIEMRAMKNAIAKPPASATALPELVAEMVALRRAFEEQMTPSGKRDRFSAFVQEMGLEGAPANAAAKALRKRQGESKERASEVDLRECVRDALADHLRVSAFPLSRAVPRIIAVVGPSGVGKTTTVAKLAARAVLEMDLTVTLVACDTFRVGAVDQLARYASALDTRFRVAKTHAELARIVDESETDLVIIDTSGQPDISPDGIEQYFAQPNTSSRERDVLLCMNASTRIHDAKHIAKLYAGLHPTSLAITKIDETPSPAGLVHATAASGLPVSTLCFGPRVPEDIGNATMGAMLDHLAPLSSGGARR